MAEERTAKAEIELVETNQGAVVLLLAGGEVLVSLDYIRQGVGSVALEHLDAWAERLLARQGPTDDQA